jgi:hypothetical protein
VTKSHDRGWLSRRWSPARHASAYRLRTWPRRYIKVRRFDGLREVTPSCFFGAVRGYSRSSKRMKTASLRELSVGCGYFSTTAFYEPIHTRSAVFLARPIETSSRHRKRVWASIREWAPITAPKPLLHRCGLRASEVSKVQHHRRVVAPKPSLGSRGFVPDRRLDGPGPTTIHIDSKSCSSCRSECDIPSRHVTPHIGAEEGASRSCRRPG